jgi:hypothetical protein
MSSRHLDAAFRAVFKRAICVRLMFIVDPFFTGILALTLLLGKIFKSRQKRFIFGGIIFVVLYLLVESLNHNLAYNRMEEVLRQEGIAATKFPRCRNR